MLRTLWASTALFASTIKPLMLSERSAVILWVERTFSRSASAPSHSVDGSDMLHESVFDVRKRGESALWRRIVHTACMPADLELLAQIGKIWR